MVGLARWGALTITHALESRNIYNFLKLGKQSTASITTSDRAEKIAYSEEQKPKLIYKRIVHVLPFASI